MTRSFNRPKFVLGYKIKGKKQGSLRSEWFYSFMPRSQLRISKYIQIELSDLANPPPHPCNKRAELTSPETNNTCSKTMRTYFYLNSALRKIDFICNFFSHEDVRIFCFREELFQNFKLRFGKRCSLSALFSWRN